MIPTRAGMITYLEKDLINKLFEIDKEYYHFYWLSMTVLTKIATRRKLSGELSDIMIMTTLSPKHIGDLFKIYSRNNKIDDETVNLLHKMYDLTFDLVIMYKKYIADEIDDEEYLKKEDEFMEDIENAFQNLKNIYHDYDEKWFILINQACNILKIKIAGLKVMLDEDMEEDL